MKGVKVSAAALMVAMTLVGLADVAEPEYEMGLDGKTHPILSHVGGGNSMVGAYWKYAKDDTATHNWIDGAIAVFTSGNAWWESGMNLNAYALRKLGTENYPSFGNCSYNSTLNLGPGGLLVQGQWSYWLKASNTLHLTASQTWTTTDGSRGEFLLNTTSQLYANPFVLTAADDITLTLSGNFIWRMNQQAAFEKVDVSVVKPAKIYLSSVTNTAGVHQGGCLNARTLTSDGATISVISYTGDDCRLASNVVLKSGAELSVNSDQTAGLALDGFADSISVIEGTGKLAGNVAPAADVFPVSAAEGATLQLAAKWDGAPRLALSGAGTILLAGSGSTPIIASADGFTGRLDSTQGCTFEPGVLENFQGIIVHRTNLTYAVTYPASCDLTHVGVTNGATVTINYYTPNAPASFDDGITIATGVGTGVARSAITVNYLQTEENIAYHKSMGVTETLTEGTLAIAPTLPRKRLKVVDGGSHLHTSTCWASEDNPETKITWTEGSIATLLNANHFIGGGTIYFYQLNTPTNATAGFIRGTDGNNDRLHVGAGGMDFPCGGPTLWNMQEFRLVAPQTWWHTNRDSSVVFTIGNDAGGVPLLTTADPDCNLTIVGGLGVCLRAKADFRNSDITLDGTLTNNKAEIVINGDKSAASTARGITLNARTLTLKGHSVVTVNSNERMEGGYTIAKDVVFEATEKGVPELVFGTDSNGGVMCLDVGSLAAVGTGVAGKISGKTRLVDDTQPLAVSATEGATLCLSPEWSGAPQLALSGAGSIELSGSGTMPVIASATGFTGRLVLNKTCTFAPGVLESFAGTIVYQKSVTLSTHYPTPFDFSHYAVAGGAKITLEYFSPYAPVTYTNGMTVATGLGTGVSRADLTVSYLPEDTASTYAKNLGITEKLSAEGTLTTQPTEPRLHLKYVGAGDYMDETADKFVVWGTTEPNVHWTDGSIVYFTGGNSRISRSAWSPYQIVVTNSRAGFIGGKDGHQRLHLGAGGMALYTNGPELWELTEFRLVAPQTWWHTNTDSSINFRIGSLNYSGVPDLTTADPDCNLTVLGSVQVEQSGTADFRDSDITLDGTMANNPAQWLLDGDLTARTAARTLTLNARMLTMKGNAKIRVRSDDRVADGYTIAKDVVLEARENAQPFLMFEENAAGEIPGMDVGTIRVTGSGASGYLTGTAYLLHDEVPITIDPDASLSFSAGFTNVATKSSSVTFHGSGRLICACKSVETALRLTAENLADFTGNVTVASDSILALDGPVDFSSLILQNGAILAYNVENGAKIVDWSKVTFPESGTIRIHLKRATPYAATTPAFAVNGDFSGVSAANRAKILVTVDDGQGDSPYSVQATPRFVGNTLYVDCQPTFTHASGTACGKSIWLGEDWADITTFENWAYYADDDVTDPTKRTIDFSKHPTSQEQLYDWICAGIYSSMNWRLDLGGRTWYCRNMRNNSSKEGHYYALSNGTMHAQGAMLFSGGIDIWNGARYLVHNFDKSAAVIFYWLSTKSGDANPFRITVHTGGEMQVTSHLQGMNFHHLLCTVEDGGRLELSADAMGLMSGSKVDSAFVNYGTMSFPSGWVTTNHYGSSAITATCTVDQRAGRLEYAGAFDVAQRDGCQSNATYRLLVSGGTLAPTGDVSFAEWDLQIAENATFGIEAKAGETATLGAFNWGEGFALTKTGAGLFDLTITNHVDAGAITVREGALVNGTICDVESLVLTYADDGSFAADPQATGEAAEYGLFLTNATISAESGTYRVAFTHRAKSQWVTILTVPTSADPGLTEANVTFVDHTGREIAGELNREVIKIGGVSYVRYAVQRTRYGVSIFVR